MQVENNNEAKSLTSYGFLKIDKTGKIIGISITDLDNKSIKYIIDDSYYKNCKVIIPGLKPFTPDSSELTSRLYQLIIGTSPTRILFGRGGTTKVLINYMYDTPDDNIQRITIEKIAISMFQY